MNYYIQPNNLNNINNNIYIIVFFVYNNNEFPLKVNVKTKISTLIKAYRDNTRIYDQSIEFYFNNIVLNPNLSVEEAGLQHYSKIYVIKKMGNNYNRVDECLTSSQDINNNKVDECLTLSKNKIYDYIPEGYNLHNDTNNNINIPLSQSEKLINIKFIKQPKENSYKPYSYTELHGILKLCLLKEISPKLNDYQIKQLPEIVAYIMKILKNGYSDTSNIQKNIKDVLEKMKGSNIISFSRYVNEIINLNELNKITALLKNGELNEINDIKNRLSKYNEHAKQFEREFEKAKEIVYLNFQLYL